MSGTNRDDDRWVTLERLCNGIPACGVAQALLILERRGYEVDWERAKVKLHEGERPKGDRP